MGSNRFWHIVSVVKERLYASLSCRVANNNLIRVTDPPYLSTRVHLAKSLFHTSPQPPPHLPRTPPLTTPAIDTFPHFPKIFFRNFPAQFPSTPLFPRYPYSGNQTLRSLARHFVTHSRLPHSAPVATPPPNRHSERSEESLFDHCVLRCPAPAKITQLSSRPQWRDRGNLNQPQIASTLRESSRTLRLCVRLFFAQTPCLPSNKPGSPSIFRATANPSPQNSNHSSAEIYEALSPQPRDIPAIKRALRNLLHYLATDGRTNPNCWATDLFFMSSTDWEFNWAEPELPEDLHNIFVKMSEALHDTVSAPEIASNFGCLPEQLLADLEKS